MKWNGRLFAHENSEMSTQIKSTKGRGVFIAFVCIVLYITRTSFYSYSNSYRQVRANDNMVVHKSVTPRLDVLAGKIQKFEHWFHTKLDHASIM